MASLTLKDIPPELLERLRCRAKEERRSLSAEAMTILERVLSDYRTPEERERTYRRLQEIADAGGKDMDRGFETIRSAPAQPIWSVIQGIMADVSDEQLSTIPASDDIDRVVYGEAANER